MRYFHSILLKKWHFLLGVALLGIVNSVLFSLLPLIISSELNKVPLPFVNYHYNWVVFVVVAGASYLSKRLFQGKMIVFTNSLLLDLETEMQNNLRGIDYESFIKLDTGHVFAVISDVRAVAQFPRFFIDVINNIVVILISFIYMFWLSAPAAMFVLLAALLVIMRYYSRNREVGGLLQKARDLENNYYRYLNDFFGDYKRIRMDSVKEGRLFDEFLQENRKMARSLEADASVRYMNNELMGNYSWFFILGIFIFALPTLLDLGASGMGSFVIVILYLIGPVSTCLTSFPFFGRLMVAFSRIERFMQGAGVQEKDLINDSGGSPVVQRIRFDEVRYSLTDEESGRSFSLGSLDVLVNKGDVIFITGENGSGKSTFLLLLTGLIKPQSGRILLNDIPLAETDVRAYRRQFASVFTDSMLFTENYANIDLSTSNQDLAALLQLFRLEYTMFGYTDGESPGKRLSKGQQKRLSLLLAILEEKDVLLLDEWAAEQDPGYRNYFYTVLVPYLRDRGKTVIAVTHDDKYFHCASRIITFHNGQITRDHYCEPVKEKAYA